MRRALKLKLGRVADPSLIRKTALTAGSGEMDRLRGRRLVIGRRPLASRRKGETAARVVIGRQAASSSIDPARPTRTPRR